MRNARVMLSILCLIAFAGVSLAFKAKNFSLHYVYTGVLNSGVCQTKVDGRFICNGTPNVAGSTTPLASGCPNICTMMTAD